MKLAAAGARFRVIDDFLNPRDLEGIRQVMSERSFGEVASVVDPEADGSALRSRGTILRYDTPEGGDTVGGYRAVMQEMNAHTDMFGIPGQAWSIVGFTFWQYAAGSRLGWHNDLGSGRQGEFILFLHPIWDASWAGELLLLDADPNTLPVSDPDLPPPDLVTAKVSQASSCLTAIVPKPNRLVLVKEGTIHCIQRVDRTAGSVMRQTMTGFLAASPSDKQQTASSFQRLTRLLGSE